MSRILLRSKQRDLKVVKLGFVPEKFVVSDLVMFPHLSSLQTMYQLMKSNMLK